MYQKKNQFSVEALEQRILLSAVPMDGAVFEGEDNALEQTTVVLDLGENETVSESGGGEDALFADAVPLDSMENSDGEAVDSQALPPAETSPESTADDVLSAASDFENGVAAPEISGDVGAAGADFEAPYLPGLQLVDTAADDFAGQVVYLDFGGAGSFDYAGPLVVNGAEQSAFFVPGRYAGEGLTETAAIASVVEGVQSIFGKSGLTFVSGTDPPTGEYSTIFVGGDDAAFREYGQFYGLAEAVDTGNSDRSDRAFVFSETIAEATSSPNAFINQLIAVTARETGRLVGYQNTVDARADHSALFSVANQDDLTDLTLTETQRDYLYDGLQAFKTLLDSIEADTALGELLQAVGETVTDFSEDDGLNLAEASQLAFSFLNGVVGELDSLLNPTDGALPTNSEIITALESVSQTIGDLAITIDPTSVFGGRDDSNNELIFGLKLEASQSLADLPLDLGQLANEAGLFSVEDLTVDATGSLLLDMEFGLDLASLGSAAEAFFIRANEARAGITGSASDLNFGINVGFLEASVDGGSVNFEQTVDISLANPDGDAGNRITRSEFESTALENLVDVSVDTASFTATLPVSASLDGLTPVGTPRVELSSDDLLASPPSVSFVDFDGFVDFTSLDASSMVNLLTDLVDLLTRFEESAFLDTQIPFTDLQIGQVVQMGGILNDQVLTHLRDDEGVLGFQSIQEFVPFLEGLLGLNEGDLGWDYLAGTQELVLPFDLSKAFDPLDVDLNLDEDFGPLEVYTSSSNISLSVDASLALEVRIDLSQPQASVTGDQALPSDGVLANDAVFEISLNGGEVIELLVAPDASNASDADPVEALVADINLAIAASALAGRVQASLNPENKLVLTSFTFGPSPSILVRGPAVDAGDDNAADDDLGLAGVLFDDSPLSERVTLSEANLNASLELNTTAEGGPSGISAGATLGFVGVTVGNGEIDFDASVQADLVNGESLVIADVISALIDGDAASALNPDIQYSSSGFLDLSDIEVGGDLLDGPAATASIRIEVDGSAFFGDGGGDPFTVTFDGDFGEVFDFESLSFADVLAAIIDVGNELQDSASESFLSTTIPFLDVSVNELFDMAEPVLDLIERIADSETRSLQQLDLFIREFLITQYDTFRPEFEANGLSLPAIPDQLVSTVDDVILLDLSLVAGITEDLSFALDAGDAIPGLDRLLDLRGQTDLQLGVTSLINLKLGIDVSDPLDPQFHLYDGSGIEGGVFLEADNIEFDGAIGPIGVFVRDGSLSIGDAENPAGINFSLDVADPDPTDGLPGRIALSDLGIDDFTFEVIGSIDADIPLRFPSEAVSDEIGSVSLNALLSDLDSATLSFSSPSGDSLEDIIAGLDFGETFGSGVDLFFIALEELADGDIFGIELPFIGDALADVSTFLLDIRNSLDAAFTNAAEFAEAALETALFDALGPDGANILLPQSGTGTPEASDVDVTLVLDAADLPEEVIIDVRLGNLETLTPDLAFDLGLPGLALELEDEGGSSSLNIEFGWEFDLVFGVSTSDGFFVETSALDELSVDLLVTLPSTDLVGTLGVIQARARDKFPGDPAERSQLDLGFTVDLKDPTGTDTRLTLGEMTQDFDNAFTAELSGAARLNLELEVGFASLSGDPIDALPSFLVDFLLDWDLSYQFDGFSDTNLIGGTPSVEFNNIRLDVGSFFDDFLRPIADTVENYVAPLRPIVDFLTTRVAPLEVGPLKDIFEDPNDNDDIVTFLDIAVLTGRVSSGTSNFIQTLDLVLNIVDSVANGSLPGKGDNLQIPLGNFAFGNLDLRDGNLGSIDPAVDGIFTDDGQTLEEKFNNIVGGAGADIFSATQETAPDGSGKFEFLLFQPENLVNLLMGNPVDFFQFTLPQFGFDFSLSKSVPIFAPPPVNLNFSLGFSAEINLAFGYDSSGIEKFLQPDGKPSDIFGGFYVVSGDAAPPLLELEGFLSGGVGVGVPGVLTVNADVRLIAEADFSLIDPDDGKLYFSTIADLVEREGPEVFKCLFHIEGGISGEFKISLETLFITVFSIGPEFDIVSFTVDPADCFLHQLPDRFERVEDGRFNNDTVGLAADIGTGPGIHLRGTSISSNGDIDWYRFNTQQSEDLRVELDGESHLQIEVQNSDGNIIDASNSGSERKVLNFAGLPEGEYFIKVSSQDDELSEYELNIDPAANSSTRVFYINDSAVTDPTVNSYYTLAPGDNANDGMTPDAPMATLDALLAAYDLEPGDLVLMDSGLYGGNATIAAADSGLTLAGTPRVLYTQLLEDGDIPVEFGRSPADLTGSNFNGAGTQLTTDGISDLRLSGFGFQSDGSGTGLSIQGGGSIEIFDAGFKDIDIGLQVDGTSDLTLRDIQVEATRLGMDITDADNLVANSIHIEGTGSEQGARAVDSSNINFGLLSGTQLDNILTLDTISDFQINQVIGNDVALAVSVVDSLGTTTPAQLNGLRLEAAERGIEVVNSQNIRIQGANFDGDGTETDESGEPLAPRGLLAIKVTDSDDIEILSPRIRDFEAGIQFASGVNGSLDSATLTDLDEALFLNGTDGFEVSGGVWTLSEAGIRLTDAVNTLVDGTEMDFSDGEGARKAIDAGVATLAQAGNNQFQNMTVVAGSVDLNDQEDALVQSNALTDGGIVLTDNLNTEVVENTIEYPEGLGSPGIQVLASAGVIVLDNTVDGAVTGLGVGSGTQDLLAETNDLSRGTFGINLLDASVLGTELTGNLVSGFSDTGIRAPVQALITDNDVSDSGIGIDYDGADIGLTGNQIHNNTIGLTGSGLLGADGPEDVVVNNIFDNVTGVIAKNGVDVQFNRIYDNLLGIAAANNTHIHHNRIFRNTGFGIEVAGDSGVLIDNNTVYSTQDDSIRIVSGSSDTTLRNNIIWNTEGYGIYVADDSQPGFDSDYNNLFTSGNGRIVWYQKPFEDVLDWQIEARQDLNSIGTTVPDPNLDQPLFVDLAGDNYRIQTGATTINSGDPSYAFDDEPGPNGGPNGLRINQGAFGGTAQAAESPASYLRILSPEFYVDYNVDVARRIVWEAFNVSGNVKLEVHEAGVGKVADITTVAVDNLPAEISSQEPRIGSYIWSPQQDGLDTDINRRYFLRLISADDSTIRDDNREPFSVPEQNNDFYLNDDSAAGDTFTTSPGDNRNTGKSPGDPKAILPALLQNYQLGANQTVHADAGYYMHVVDLVISADGTTGNDEAFVIEGSTGGVVFDRANERPGTHSLEILDADFLTLRNLTLEGGEAGLKIHNQSIFFKGENLDVSDHPEFGISIIGGSDNSTLQGVTVSGNGGHGITIDGTVLELTDSTIINNGDYGLDLWQTGDAVITGNYIEGNERGISIFNNVGTVTTIGNADTSLGLGNILTGNTSYGIRASGKVLVAGNTVSNQTSPTSFGIHSNNVDVLNNVVFGNGRGIYIDDPNLVEGNRSYNNREYGIGVSNSATVRHNISYSNQTGLLIFRNSNQVSNNLFYANDREAVRLDGTSSNSLVNNTLYQPVGDGMRLIGSPNTDIRNNIIVVQDGFALRLDLSSQSDLNSNFNLLRAEGDAEVGFWQGFGRESLIDWQNAARQDRQSLDRDPFFVDPTGADGRLGYFSAAENGADDDFHVQSQFGSFHGGSLAVTLNASSGLPVFASATLTVDGNQSPAIDLGDDTSDFANEPADNGNFVNLGVYGNTDQASKSPPEYVLVTNPDGGETWIQEQDFTIRWRSHDFNGDVDILLQRDGEAGPVLTIADDTANDGEFVWTLPNTLPEGDGFRIEVVRQDDPSIAGESFDPFAISPPISFFYVNDDTVIADGFATGVGNDANDGLSPATPKATIQSVLESYALGEGDVILVDAGEYVLTTNIEITAADAGVTIRGFIDPARPDEVTLLDRANTSSDAYVFELNDADGVIFEQLTITGGYYGIFADRDLDSDDLVIQDNTIYGNERYGIYLERGNDRPQILNNTFFGDSDGSDTQDDGAYVTNVAELEFSGNTAYGHRQRGLYGTGLYGAKVEGNTTYDNGSDGIFVRVRNGYTGIVQGNESFNNGDDGIQGSGDSVILSENLVYGHTGSSDAGIWAEDGALARDNLTYGNYYGIVLDDGATAENNRVYDNSQAGIRISDNQREIVRGNQIYSNKIGIDSRQNNDLIENNLIYDNAQTGIRLENGDQAIVRNNMIYQLTGTGIALINDSRFVTLRNNIVRSDDGLALSVSSNSQEGFDSDYNIYRLGADADLLQWGSEVFDDRLDIFFFLDLEANSLLTDPEFIDIDGDDGILGYDSATDTDGGLDDNFRLAPSSPAVDAGDPLSYFLAELQPNGGRVNIGAYGNTIEATNSPVEVVQILTPNGFEKFQVGEDVGVEFRTWGLLDEQVLGLINVGGGTVDRWLAENFNTSGDSTSSRSNAVDVSGVANPAPESVYQTYRYDSNDPLVYAIPLPDGDYTVKLHFNTLEFSEGRDVFDIALNGTTVTSGFDPRVETGERYKAIAKSYQVNLSGGESLEIRLDPITGDANLSAIELLQPNPGGTTAPTVDLEFSDDGAGSFDPLAAGLSLDRFGNGTFTWTPDTETGGNDGFLRAVANTGGNAQGQSRDAFLVTNAGKNYYLNDDDTTGDVFTTAVGENLNSGKSPDDPMASLFALFKAYSIGGGDTVHIDTGTYVLRQNITLTAANAGMTLLGPSTETALLDRANLSSGTAVLELIDADNVTVENLSITGAETGILADRDNDSDGVVLRNNEIFGNDRYGVEIDRGNDNWTLVANEFYGLPEGSNFDQDLGVLGSNHSGTGLRNNVFYNHRSDGLRLSGVRDIHFEGNESRDNRSDGFEISLNGGGISEIRDNLARNNEGDGFRIRGEEALVINNVAHGQNQRSSYNGFDLQSGATARNNLAYDNGRGVRLDATGVFEGNRIYNNQTDGIFASDFATHRIRDNDIYGNQTGISLGRGNDVIENNRIYANSQIGIHLDNSDGTLIRNNTIYQTDGTGVSVTDQSWDVELRNNIVHMDAGTAINVTKNSQRRFDSDYNLFDLGTDADWLNWGSTFFNERPGIFYELGIERHSRTGDARFVDPAGPDGILGFDTDTGTDGGLDDNFRLQSNSPAIDAGDPAAYFLAEPGPNGFRVNIGAYGNTGEATTGAASGVRILNPAPFDKFEQGEVVPIEFFSFGYLDTQTLAQINAAGPTRGQWSYDAFNVGAFSTRSISTNTNINLDDVVDPAPESVYRTYTQAPSGVGNALRYAFPVQDGSYQVRLHFVPTSFSSGSNVFDIEVNDALLEADYDPRAEADRYAAVTETFDVTAADGDGLDLSLINKSGVAELSAIEIIQTGMGGAENPGFTVSFSSDGGTAYNDILTNVPVDSTGRGTVFWTADTVTNGLNGRIRIAPEDGSGETFESTDPFRVDPVSSAFYINDSSNAGDVYTTAIGDNANSGRRPDAPMAS
ncbi:MAG: LEPR-XLL domain-containing protein, partial [Verrucomicrobia bacterium]|nr:LEPR-XLL domain-containing protein [Verrucomicrobiota bacterium]